LKQTENQGIIILSRVKKMTLELHTTSVTQPTTNIIHGNGVII